MIKTKQKNYKLQTGFTLIEVLVVVTILIILTSILVPRLRMVTKERDIREAARVVNSMISQASQRAVTDGTAGVVLFRNPNFVYPHPTLVDGAGNPLVLPYAVTKIGLLRAVPDYRGDDDSARARLQVLSGNTQIFLPLPLEQTEDKTVLPGDSISFGESEIRYEIFAVNTPGTTQLRLRLNGIGEINRRQEYLPDPPVGPIEFTIHRMPRLVRSSVVDLPRGHLIDLRFSGSDNQDANSVFADSDLESTSDNTSGDLSYSVALLMDGDGKFDRTVYVRDDIVRQNSVIRDSIMTNRVAMSPFFAFVTAVETDLDANPLSQETNLWVSVSNSSGIVNVGYNEPQKVDLNSVSSIDIDAARGNSKLGSAAQ